MYRPKQIENLNLHSSDDRTDIADGLLCLENFSNVNQIDDREKLETTKG